MQWLILPIAFSTWMAVPLGHAIARGVPDEIRHNRSRFATAIDAFAILALAASIGAAFAWWGGAIAAALALLVRLLARTRWSAMVIGALALGVAGASDGTMIATIATLLLVPNLLRGALARDWRETVSGTAVQPIGAVLVTAVISLTLA